MSDRLSEIEGRLAAATPGPWEAVTDNDRRSKEHSVWSEGSSDYVAEWVATRPDADLIANAPADLAALVKFAREVQAVVRSDLRATLALVKVEELVNALVAP